MGKGKKHRGDHEEHANHDTPLKEPRPFEGRRRSFRRLEGTPGSKQNTQRHHGRRETVEAADTEHEMKQQCQYNRERSRSP